MGCKHWYLQHQHGGYNLFTLKDLQLLNMVAVYLNYALEGVSAEPLLGVVTYIPKLVQIGYGPRSHNVTTLAKRHLYLTCLIAHENQ